jgi:hypothetical protein
MNLVGKPKLLDGQPVEIKSMAISSLPATSAVIRGRRPMKVQTKS